MEMPKNMGNLQKQNAVGEIMIVELQETETDYTFINRNLQVTLLVVRCMKYTKLLEKHIGGPADLQ